VGAETPRVNDPLGDALVIEVKDFLAKVRIFECRGPPNADAK
jgi:hypothetical protein